MGLSSLIRDTKIGRAISRASFALYAASALSVGVLASQIGCGGDKQEGVVKGEVIDNQTNSPLPGARVSIDDMVATTGNDGRYSLNVPIGKQDILAEREEYTPYKATIYVNDGTNHHDIILVKLVQTYILRGIVIDPKNEPLGGVLIQIIKNIEKTGKSDSSKEPEIKKDTTDSSGNYQISHLAPGEYTLIATKEDYGEFRAEDVLVGNRDKDFNVKMSWDNILRGVITNDRTLRAEVGTYVVPEDVVVKEGITLSIEPGVTLKFEDSKKLTSLGSVVARGKDGNPVILTSISSLRRWRGINIQGGSITLDYCILENAGDEDLFQDSTSGMALYSDYSHAKIIVSNSIFRHNRYGIAIINENSESDIRNSTFYKNFWGVSIQADATNLRNCLLVENRYGIIIAENSPTIEYCTISSAKRGEGITNYKGGVNKPKISHSIVVIDRANVPNMLQLYHMPININAIERGTIVEYTDTWEPTFKPNQFVPIGSGNLSLDPQFGLNYHPQNPALLTAGKDGTEIGAYGNGGNPPSPNR